MNSWPRLKREDVKVKREEKRMFAIIKWQTVVTTFKKEVVPLEAAFPLPVDNQAR